MQLKPTPLTPEQQREKLANRIFSHLTVLFDGIDLRPEEVNRYRLDRKSTRLNSSHTT